MNALVLGAGLAVLGATMMAGWAFRLAGVLDFIPGYRMVFATAAGFALAGLALACEPLRERVRTRAQDAAGVLLVLLGGAVLAEYAFGLELGVDLRALHAWMPTTNANPGRMAAATALGFALAGAALLALARRAFLARALAAALGLLGAAALLGNMLNLGAMFPGYALAQVAYATAVGFVLLASGLATARREAQPSFWKSDGARIHAVSAAIVIGAALIAATAGFALMGRAAESGLRRHLAADLASRAALIERELAQRRLAAEALATRPDLHRLIHLALVEPRALAELQRHLASMLEFEFIALALSDARGRQLAYAGAPPSAPRLRLALQDDGAALAWNGGVELESRVQVTDLGARLGELHLRQPLTEMTPVQRDGRILGLCAAEEAALHCLPSVGVPQPRSRPLAEATPQMHAALAGERGVRRGPDFRGVDVIAAYAPLPALGLGMSLRVETAQLFGALRPQLGALVLLLAALAAASIVLLRWQLVPLVRRLARGEEQLRLALQGSQLALWEYNAAAASVYLSEQWNVLLGGERRSTRTSLAALAGAVHPDDAPAVNACIRQVLKGEVAHYDIEHRVRRHDGGWIWIRSRGEAAERDARGRALRVIGTNAEITTRKETELAARRQALRDALTGLGNRRYFDETLGRELARAQRSGGRVALIMADADHFKRLNDGFGHDAGDVVLRALGSLLKQSIRRSDVACRYGGEEFALVLPEASARGALQRAGAIRAAVKGLSLAHLGRPLGPITVSLGVALYPEDAPDAAGLLRAADEALYRAKKSGRDRVCMAGEAEPVA